MDLISSFSHPSLKSFGSLSSLIPSPRLWLVEFARKTVLSILQDAIHVGSLEIHENENVWVYGTQSEKTAPVVIRVVNDAFWVRVLKSADLGFSEAYMNGDIVVEDLYGVLELFLENVTKMSKVSTIADRLFTTISSIVNAFLGQTKAQARLNAIASYDQSNELFKAFLSDEMMYSCAFFSEDEGGVNGDLSIGYQYGQLESAQARKLDRVLHNARVRPGYRVLEFGTGWGALAIKAARDYGCAVDTLTLSIAQKTLAEERIRAAGLDDRIRVHLMDYRELPAEFEKAFDAFVSIEMVEHVGPKYYNTYFKIIDWALKSQCSTAVVTSSTFPECRYTTYQAEDFVRRYMWPNGTLPSATALISAANTAAAGRFTVERVENHAAHYARTLREWNHRFNSNVAQELLVKDYPALSDKAEYEAFRRKWHYLFSYAGAGFVKGYITCHILTFIRENDAPTEA